MTTEEILISILTSLPGVLIAGSISYYFSQKKYTFEKLHDKKLLYLECMYEMIISLEKDLKKYVYTTGSMMQESYLKQRKEELKPIQEKFFKFQEYFWEKEIILNESSIKVIQPFIDTSIEILSKLQVSNRLLESEPMGPKNTAYDLWKESYDIMISKLKEAKEELKKDFKSIVNG